MASLGELVIELAANTARLQSDMGKAVGIVERGAKAMNNVFAGLGALGAGASLVELAAHSIELGDNLNKAAIKAGVGARAISELAYAAKLSDVDLSSLSTALKKMQVALSEAQTGGKQQQDALAALGLSIKDLISLAPDKQFEVLGDKINQLKDPADRARAATDLFGKAGADLLPLFQDGARGIREAREEAEKVGQSFGDAQLKALANADDSVKRLKASWEGFAAALIVKAAPAITGLLDLLHGELPKAPIEDQIANINYQMSFLAGTQTERGLQRLADLQSQLAVLNQQKAPIDDFASRHAKALADVGSTPVGYQAVAQTDMSGLSDVVAAGERLHAKSLQRMFDQTQTYSEKEVRAYEDKMSSLAQLRDEGVLGEEEYRKRVAEIDSDFNRDQLADVQVMGQRVKQHYDQFTQFANEAAQDSQDAFERFLFDPFDGGLKGMLRSFIDIIRKILAEAAAAKIFGSTDSGGLGLSGLISSTVGAALGQNFGGGKASGGPLQSGKWYIAGERGPEPIWGGGAGAFASGYGGGVTQHISIDARGSSIESAKLLQASIPAIIRQSVEQARSAVWDDLTRKGLRTA